MAPQPLYTGVEPKEWWSGPYYLEYKLTYGGLRWHRQPFHMTWEGLFYAVRNRDRSYHWRAGAW